MPEKYQNKFRIASVRLQSWDYRWNAAYFVTICTRNREHFFGKINDGKMQLSGVGIIADIMWHEIKKSCAIRIIGFVCGDAQPYTWHYCD